MPHQEQWDLSSLSAIPSFAIGKAELAQTIKHRKAVDELLRSWMSICSGSISAGQGKGPLCRPHEPVPHYCLADQAKHHYAMEGCNVLLSKQYIDYLKGPYNPRHKGIYKEMQQVV